MGKSDTTTRRLCTDCVNGRSFRADQSLQSIGNSSDFSTASLSDSSTLKKMYFQSEKGSDICMKSIANECGAGTGVATSTHRTQIPLPYLKGALKTGHYTAKAQSYAKYEHEHSCVYMYGESPSSKMLRRINVNADIFECGNESKNGDKLKCIANNVKLYSK